MGTCSQGKQRRMIEDDRCYHQHKEPRAITPEYLAEMEKEYDQVKYAAESFGAGINARYVRDLLVDRKKLLAISNSSIAVVQSLVNPIDGLAEPPDTTKSRVTWSFITKIEALRQQLEDIGLLQRK